MKKLIPIMILLVTLFSCGDDNKDYLVTIKTSMGDMKVILYNETPLHKKNFIELARSGEYDSTEWHRVIKNFMIQGGDIYAKNDGKEPEKDRIPAELDTDFLHTKGSLAAARQGDNVNPEKMSSGSQFYVVHGKVFTEGELTVDQVALNRGISELLQKPEYDTLKTKFLELQEAGRFDEMSQLAMNYVDLVEQELGISLKKEISNRRLEAYTTVGGAPHLDGEYTVFGRVVEGLEVIDKIAAVETNRYDRPVTPVYMTMEVTRISKKEIEKKYGYTYPEENR